MLPGPKGSGSLIRGGECAPQNAPGTRRSWNLRMFAKDHFRNHAPGDAAWLTSARTSNARSDRPSGRRARRRAGSAPVRSRPTRCRAGGGRRLRRDRAARKAVSEAAKVAVSTPKVTAAAEPAAAPAAQPATAAPKVEAPTQGRRAADHPCADGGGRRSAEGGHRHSRPFDDRPESEDRAYSRQGADRGQRHRPAADPRRRWPAAVRCLCAAVVRRTRRSGGDRHRRACRVADRHAGGHRQAAGRR